MTDFAHHLGAYDWIVILVIVLSMAVGLMRGVIRETASIAAWGGAFVAARQFSEPLAARFEHSIDNSALRLAIAFIVVFVVALIVIGLVGQWLAQALHKVGLRPLDRALGALFGVLRGALIVLVLVILAAVTGVNQQRDWKQAVSTAWLEHMAAHALPILPPALAGRIHLRSEPVSAAMPLQGEA